MAMKKAELMKIPLRYFGLPRERKFPMHDEKHLRAAISYFHTAKPDKRRELARNIVRRYKELNSTIRITKKNPLYNYVPEDIKVLSESSELITPTVVATLAPILSEESLSILESLYNKSSHDSVDDIDSDVPKEYKDRERFLGTLKSVIINEDMEDDEYRDYPLMYTDFTVLSDKLSGNNGGIKSAKDPIVLAYDGSINDVAELDPIEESDHIQFAALLREWNEMYMSGVRNLTYDRLMIESLREYFSELSDDYSKTKLETTRQKMIDIGHDPEETITEAVNCEPIELKAQEMGFPSELPSMNPDNSPTGANIFAKAVTIQMVVKGDKNDASYYDHSLSGSVK